jgi:hypothetical protein
MHITEELLRRQAGLFTAKEIAAIVGCPLRRLYYEIEMGRVTRPSTQIGRKPRRYFTVFELTSIKQQLADLRESTWAVAE